MHAPAKNLDAPQMSVNELERSPPVAVSATATLFSCARRRSAQTLASESCPKHIKSSPSSRAHSEAISCSCGSPNSPPGELRRQSTWPACAQKATLNAPDRKSVVEGKRV